MSDIMNLAWKAYQPLCKNMVETMMEKYNTGYEFLKHYDGNSLSGVAIYTISGNKFYIHELFIDSTDKTVFSKWYKFWQTKADTLILKTVTLNDKLIKFLSKRGGKIIEQNGNNITMEVKKHG